MSDHYRFYELKSKIKSSAYLAASIFQQVTNNRLDKQIKLNDIKRIAYASCLNLFHTNTMFKPHPLGVSYHMYCQYIKRISHDKYQLQYFFSDANGPAPVGESGYIWSIESRSAFEIKSIHPDLLCDNDGDERVLINCWYGVFDSKKIGLFVLKPVQGSNGFLLNNKGSFSAVIIITPKPGLFPAANN